MLFSPRLTPQDSDASTLASLNQLHQVVVTTKDVSMLTQVLGKYVALAASRTARTSLPSAVSNPYENFLAATGGSTTLTLSRLSTTISNIMKAAHEVAQNSINNIKG